MRREVILPTTTLASMLARQALNAVIPPPELSQRADDARLAISEIVTNAVRHGLTLDRDHIRLVIETDDSRLRVEVEQPGAAHPTLREPPLDGEAAVGGFGMNIVERIADAWGATVGPPGLVWFEFHR